MNLIPRAGAPIADAAKHYELPLAAGISTLAGYVDASAYLALGRRFPSFMGGNSAQFGLALPYGSSLVTPALLCIVGFVAGATLGSLSRSWCRHPHGAVIGLVTSFLAIAALLTPGRPIVALVVLAIAMGAANAALEGRHEIHAGLTYVTGNLVKLGAGLAERMKGRRGQGLGPYLLLWICLAAGAATGALIEPVLQASSLWIGVAVGTVLLPVALGTDKALNADQRKTRARSSEGRVLPESSRRCVHAATCRVGSAISASHAESDHQ